MERSLPDITTLPRPVLARVESLPAGTYTRIHRHAWGQLSYAMKGVLGVRTQSGSYLAPPERAIWIPQGVEHEVVNSGPTEMRSLYIDPRALDRMPERCLVLGVTPLARELILAVAALPERYAVDGPEGRMVAVLLDQLAGLEEVRFTLPLPLEPRLRAISVQLESRPDDQRPLEELARQAGMSGRTLTRLFLRDTGLNFRQWRRRLRLLTSLARLERGESVTSVGLESGYNSTSAFIAAFRREFGATPTGVFPAGQGGRIPPGGG